MKEKMLNLIRVYLWRPYFRYLNKRAEKRVIKAEMAAIVHLKKDSSQNRVFYLGITPHSNLGDIAQHYCICKWIENNYPDYELLKFEARTVVSDESGFLVKLKQIYTDKDIIVFQSGYTTQDLGGQHELMHRMLIDAIPTAHILMMPQTIFFQHEENRKRCAENHCKAKRMLFLARDSVSFKQAKVMFKGIKVAAYPDIVTTLIGTLDFKNQRDGVCICRRNDGEKYYSNAELNELVKKISVLDNVCITDTSIKENYLKVRKNMRYYVEREIEKFSHYKVTITDRYHGTIFSLIAGTPVIIIKTTDHKVTSGADWFKGIYDDYVFVANNLDEAFELYQKIVSKKFTYKLSPFMKEHYYDRLKDLFETI